MCLLLSTMNNYHLFWKWYRLFYYWSHHHKRTQRTFCKCVPCSKLKNIFMTWLKSKEPVQIPMNARHPSEAHCCAKAISSELQNDFDTPSPSYPLPLFPSDGTEGCRMILIPPPNLSTPDFHQMAAQNARKNAAIWWKIGVGDRV